MPTTANKQARYKDLFDLPENMIGEIIDGEIVATPRPSPRHGRTASDLTIEIGSAYRFGRGGPGGWWILGEVEVRLDESILVPDIAGWRRERLPDLPETNWIEVRPDWVCEVLSPGTVRTDRVKKMPIYARAGVPFLWLLDPENRTLEVYCLESGKWSLSRCFEGDDKVRAEPFQEIELNLGQLWA